MEAASNFESVQTLVIPNRVLLPSLYVRMQVNLNQKPDQEQGKKARKRLEVLQAIGVWYGRLEESLTIQVIQASGLKHLHVITNHDPLRRIVLLRCVDRF